jgi:hypothetical protein
MFRSLLRFYFVLETMSYFTFTTMSLSRDSTRGFSLMHVSGS